MRSRLISPLLVLVAALALPAVAEAGPISVTYTVTGGQAFGGLLGDAPIQSGTIVVTMPNPGSGPPPLLTGAPSLSFKLTATNGSTYTHLFLAGFFHYGTASYGPAQADRFDLYYRTPVTYADYTRTVHLSVSAGGNILAGGFSSGRFGFYTPETDPLAYVCCRRTGSGVMNITGQEVLVPEPAPAPLSLLALLGTVGLGGSAELARRRLRRRHPAPGRS